MALGRSARRGAVPALGLALALALGGTPAYAHPDQGVTDDPGDVHSHSSGVEQLEHLSPQTDPAAPLEERDTQTRDLVSSGPTAKVTKNLAVAGRGERLAPEATTDVWVHDGYAYLGTFNSPCGTGEGFGSDELVQGVEGPGVPVFDVHNPNKPTYLGNIPSVEGSRINDVKVASMTAGEILVHSNEPCDGGPGGFEVYDVSDPATPVHLAHVQTDDVNVLLRERFGFTDHGVHNNYLFTRDGRDYNAVQVEGLTGSFQVFDITDPANITLASWFGAEYVLDPTVDWATTTDFGKILEANAYLNSGYGASQNRFLHDHYVTPDGGQAYLANWDAGLLLVDLGRLDGSAATLISQAIDPTSEDGEVNSHSVWPTADGRTVIEGEEDFAPFKLQLFIDEGLVGIFDAAEAAFTPKVVDLEGRGFGGDSVYVGLGCDTSAAVPAGDGNDVAVVQRGACRFDEKVENIQDAGGYQAVVIFNSAGGGESLITPSGDPRELPTVFVARSTGLAIFGLTPETADQLEIGARGEPVNAESVADGWSGMRIWDYSDPANPVLASTFNTVCSANPLDASCDPRGTYSSHNVVVEGTRAYISWYADGVVVLDLADPYNPVEVARYHESGKAFEAQNAGIQDVWGIYKEPNKPWIYASDRNGGLYVLKEYGAGSAKNGKSGVGGKG